MSKDTARAVVKDLRAGDLTAEHIGKVVLDVPGIAGWERHLLLSDIERRKDGLWLGFRWNDDPSPQNTKRGQYACGRRVDPATPVRVFPPGGSWRPAASESITWGRSEVREGDQIVVRDANTREVVLRHVVTAREAESCSFALPSLEIGRTYTMAHEPKRVGEWSAWSAPAIFETRERP